MEGTRTMKTTTRVAAIMLGALVGVLTATSSDAQISPKKKMTTDITQTADPLPSWNDGKAKQAIVTFVANVTKEGSPGFVPAGGAPSLIELMAAGHSNMTIEEFELVLKKWLATAKHPTTGRLYTEMAYQPMIELLAYLRANRFKTYIVSGGGVDFMRGFAEKVYGVPPEQVIGSEGKLTFEMRDGKPVLFKVPALDYFDDKEAKPIAIQKSIGRRPIAAFGNSDGDLQMLQWTAAGAGHRLMMLIDHTDATREFAYRVSPMGRLDVALTEATQRGWTVVSMKDDWKRIFAFE
jgi:hypothetical protein